MLDHLSDLTDFPTFAEQCATADEKFFDKICLNNNHVIYCTVFFLLLQLSHRATIFDLECTVWNCRNILAIWLTSISLLRECFLLTFTKLFFVSVYLQLRFVNLSIKRIWMNEHFLDWLNPLYTSQSIRSITTLCYTVWSIFRKFPSVVTDNVNRSSDVKKTSGLKTKTKKTRQDQHITLHSKHSCYFYG